MTTPVESGLPHAGGQPEGQAGPWGASGGARPRTGTLQPRLLVGTVITLALTWVGTLALFLTIDDRPDSYVGERLLQQGAVLVLVVAPVALLVSQREYDLTITGTVIMGAYVYLELADSGIAVALLACAGVGLGVGAVIGVIRVLTGAPSALVTLGAGLLLQAIAFKAESGGELGTLGSRELEEGLLGGAGWIVGTALVVLILAVLASLVTGGDPAGQRPEHSPAPTVIVGFALSCMAGVLSGGLLLGSPALGQRPILTLDSNTVLMVFTAVAVGGVVAGSRTFAPVAAAVAAPAVVLLVDVPQLRDWEGSFIDGWLLLSGAFLACLVIAHGARRLLVTPSDATSMGPTGAVPDLGAPPPGYPAPGQPSSPPPEPPTAPPGPQPAAPPSAPSEPPAPPPPPPVPEGS